MSELEKTSINLSKMNNPSRIFGYCRVSCGEPAERGNKIEVQIKTIDDYCLNHDVKLDQLYKDEGLSGSLEAGKRPGLGRLFLELKKGDTLLVSKRCRLSRSIKEARSLCSVEAIIVSCDHEAFPGEDPASILFRNVVDSVNKLEQNVGIERTKATMAKIAENKALKKVTGAIPYGFRAEGKHLVMDKSEQFVVNYVMDLYNDGYTRYRITKMLNDAGYTKRNNTKFSHRNTDYIVLNYNSHQPLRDP